MSDEEFKEWQVQFADSFEWGDHTLFHEKIREYKFMLRGAFLLAEFLRSSNKSAGD